MEDELCAELTIEELKEAFRLFDDTGDGYISVIRFRVRGVEYISNDDYDAFKAILKEIDEDFTEEELDGIISVVSLRFIKLINFCMLFFRLILTSPQPSILMNL